MRISSLKCASLGLILFLGFSPSAKSDDGPTGGWHIGASYDMAVPLGDVRDFGGAFSPLGFALDFRYLMDPNWSLGFTTGWQTFDDKTSGTIQLDNGNITLNGTQNRYMNAFPILASGHYYFREGIPEWCLAFAGLNVGAYWAERRADIGLFSASDSAWHFGLAPEIGIGMKRENYLPFLRLRYNHLLGSGGTDALPYLTISIGAAWKS